MLDSKFAGYTFPDGETIHLYPNAFKNREQLVKTLGHEYVHLKQFEKYGSVKDVADGIFRESEAYASQDGWWKKYVKKTQYG